MPRVTSADGPVAVTGASGYIGSHAVIALVKKGYTVRACVTDQSNPDKIEHLLALNRGTHPGSVELRTANLLREGSYDEIFSGCSAVLQVGSPMGYGNANGPRQVYDGTLNGTRNVLNSIRNPDLLSESSTPVPLPRFLIPHRLDTSSPKKIGLPTIAREIPTGGLNGSTPRAGWPMRWARLRPSR